MGHLRSTGRRFALTSRAPHSAYWTPLGDFEKHAGRRHSLYEPLAGPDADLRRSRNATHADLLQKQYITDDPVYSLWSRIRKGEHKPEPASLHEILTHFSAQPNRALHINAIEKHLAATKSLDDHALRLCINGYFHHRAPRLIRLAFNNYVDNGGQVSDQTLALFISRMFALGYAVDCRDCVSWALAEPSAKGATDGGAAACTVGPLTNAAMVRVHAELRDIPSAVASARAALSVPTALPAEILETVIVDVVRAHANARTPPEAEAFWSSVEALLAEAADAADRASGVTAGADGIRLGASFRTPRVLSGTIDALAEGLLTPQRKARFRRRITDPLWDGALARAGHALSAVVPIEPDACWGGDIDEGDADAVARWRGEDVYTALLRLAAVVNHADADGIVDARLLALGAQQRKPLTMYEPLLTVAAAHRDDLSGRGAPLRKTDKLDLLLSDMEADGVQLTDGHHAAILRGFGISGRHWHVDNYAVRRLEDSFHSWLPSDEGKAAVLRELVFAYGATRQVAPLRQLRAWYLPAPFFGTPLDYRPLADIYAWGARGKWSHMTLGGHALSVRTDMGAKFPDSYYKVRPVTMGGGKVGKDENVNPRIPRPATEAWNGQLLDGDDGTCKGLGSVKIATVAEAGLDAGDGRVWSEFIHALIAADQPVPFELPEYFMRDHPRSHRFYWGLRWIKHDNRRKWRIFDGPNATWQMAMQMAHHDGLQWWDL